MLHSPSHPGLFIFSFDCAPLGTLLVFRSFAYMEFLPSVLDLVHSKLSASLQSLARLDPRASLLGLARAGPLFSLPITECCHLGPPPSFQMSSYLDASLPTSDCARLDLSAMPKGLHWVDAVLLMFGVAHYGLLFLLLVTEITHPETLSLLQSLSHVSLTLSVPDRSNLEASLMLQVLS